MSFYGIIYSLCAIEFIDILDFLDSRTKTILMLVVTILSIIIQFWRTSKGKKDKTKVENVLDNIAVKLEGTENKKEEVKEMYEVKMSELVKQICSLYAQENGLNYPPCTQQMLNAVTEWLNKNAIDNVKSVTSQISGQNEVTLTITYTHPDGSETQDTISFTVQTVKGETGATGAPGTPGADGKDGAEITTITAGSPTISGDYSQTLVTVNMSDGTQKIFTISVKNGENGQNGRGVTAIAAGNPTTDPTKPGYTSTPVTAVFTDGSSNTFSVYAKDGEKGEKGETGEQGAQGNSGAFQGILSFNKNDLSFTLTETFNGTNKVAAGNYMICTEYSSIDLNMTEVGVVFKALVDINIGDSFTVLNTDRISEICTFKGANGKNGTNGTNGKDGRCGFYTTTLTSFEPSDNAIAVPVEFLAPNGFEPQANDIILNTYDSKLYKVITTTGGTAVATYEVSLAGGEKKYLHSVIFKFNDLDGGLTTMLASNFILPTSTPLNIGDPIDYTSAVSGVAFDGSIELNNLLNITVTASGSNLRYKEGNSISEYYYDFSDSDYTFDIEDTIREI